MRNRVTPLGQKVPKNKKPKRVGNGGISSMFLFICGSGVASMKKALALGDGLIYTKVCI